MFKECNHSLLRNWRGGRADMCPRWKISLKCPCTVHDFSLAILIGPPPLGGPLSLSCWCCCAVLGVAPSFRVLARLPTLKCRLCPNPGRTPQDPIRFLTAILEREQKVDLSPRGGTSGEIGYLFSARPLTLLIWFFP